MDLQSLPWYGQFAVFMVIGIVILGIFYYVHYSPTSDQIDNIEADIEIVEREIKKAEQKESKLQQIKEELVIKEEILEKLKAILPEKEEISQILKKIQSIIASARLRIQKYDPQNLRAREVYTETPISIILEGNYHSLGIFFDQLSKLKKIFTVDGLNINPLQRRDRDYTVRASFTATTYLYKETKQTTKGLRRRGRG